MTAHAIATVVGAVLGLAAGIVLAAIVDPYSDTAAVLSGLVMLTVAAVAASATYARLVRKEIA